MAKRSCLRKPEPSGFESCDTPGKLQEVLDRKYRRLLEGAKNDWHRLFAGQDPSDACVGVRISESQIADELAGVPRAGFLARPRQRRTAKVRQKFA